MDVEDLLTLERGIDRLLIANRGEIAVRIARTAREMGITTVAVFAADDAEALHVREADESRPLGESGPSAYLDIAAIVAIAKASACKAIHPGYGFLSENAAFADACRAAGVVFVGPAPETLALFGDKAKARALAAGCGLPVLEGVDRAVTLEEAAAFFDAAPPDAGIMLKAVAGGGGRGIRPVHKREELESAYARCAAEARSAFGDGALFVERIMPKARHVEVQLVGDGAQVSHIWDRECSLQRRRQKIVEWAPAQNLSPHLRAAMLEGAVRLGEAARLRSLCTVEFLVSENTFAFIEANPRLQVEHTVTEEVTGLDLVRIQLQIAAGASLRKLQLSQRRIARPRGVALQARVNCETMRADGTASPAAGRIDAYALPSGRGVRVDGCGFAGLRATPGYDSLLAKVIVHVDAGGFAAAAAKAGRALADFVVQGVATNIAFLRALLREAESLDGRVHVSLVDERLAALLPAAAAPPPQAALGAPAGAVAVTAPMIGTIVEIGVEIGSTAAAGQEVAVIEAMKMQHPVVAPVAGVVTALSVRVRDTVAEGQIIVLLDPSHDQSRVEAEVAHDADLDRLRPDLVRVQQRKRAASDEGRPAAVAKRRRTGQRTARENIADLCDPGTFVEYGALTVAGRSRRASMDELVVQSPADGLVMGLGAVNGAVFAEPRAQAAVMSYDYTVFAGTQGARNHIKTDRLVELVHRLRLPLIVFAEGGGGRPGDTDGGGFVRAFEYFPRLSGRAPLIGVVSGRCFAGNAALLGCCDVVIATRNATIGMGGPAMIEGGGLGVFAAEEIGPALVQAANGVIDVLVDDEAAAVAAAKRYLAFFQGDLADWSVADQRSLRALVPENRLRAYDVRAVLSVLADAGSVLELRAGFGRAVLTALARIEGRAVGVIANDCAVLGGAIDSDAADKAARFMQVCEAHNLPIVSLGDTPGIMVGPEAERTALVRHSARMFLAGANLTVPIFSVILRKSYGLGAIAMTGGSYQASVFSVAWPTGEFGGMGLEGAVRLGYRKELDAIADAEERRRWFEAMVARLYEHGGALNTAGYFGIDDVIDPAETRAWIGAGLKAWRARGRERGAQRWIDSW